MGIWTITGGKLWNGTAFTENPGLSRELAGEADRKLTLEPEDLILPGVIDSHVHLWAPPSISRFGMDAEWLYAQGVVGAVEPGSFGCRNWAQASCYWTNAEKLRIKSFMHVLPDGFAVFPPTNVSRPEEIDENEVAAAIQADTTDTLLGVKIHLGFLYYKSEETDRGQLRLARSIADKTGKRVLAHISGSTLDLQEVVSYLKPGDIVTHMYTGFEKNVFSGGSLSSAMLEAKKRGVIMDVGHAAKHFSWDVFRKAYGQGLTFDTISTDLTVFSFHQPESNTLYDIYHLFSAFLEIGIDRDEVFRAVTTTPAKIYGLPLDIEKQTLILRRMESHLPLADGVGGKLELHTEYRPACFVDNGKLILSPDCMNG